MRYVLTIIAVALVAVMSAALVAPMLIDWSAHRAEIEARLRAIIGANVSLTGPVEVRLLPTPYLALGAGSLSAPGPDGPKLSFDSARLELALVKLTSGQIRFSDISLDKPVLTIVRGSDGAPRLPALPIARLQSTGVDRLIVRDGRVRVAGVGNGPASEIAGVDIDAAVPSLDGPAHLTGQFSGPDDAPVVFRLASQKPGPEGTPLRVEVDAGPSWPAGEFEGVLEGDPAGGLVRLRLAGAATLGWFTIEFGLMRGRDGLKVYGSGLLSSHGEIAHAIEAPEVQRYPIQLEWAINQAFEIDHFSRCCSSSTRSITCSAWSTNWKVG